MSSNNNNQQNNILYNAGVENLEDYKEIKEAVQDLQKKLSSPSGKLAPAYVPVKNKNK